MAAKLGPLLVNANIISQVQLDEVLKNQVVFGGRLGTNIIELGYIDEDDLARFLSEQLGVPCVDYDQTADIPQEVIEIITADVANKYGAIPLSVDNKKLNLLMVDPSDLLTIDELSFITGLRIKPVIMPEVKLVLALEKYYKTPIDPRYIPIIQRIEKKKNQNDEEQKSSNNENEEIGDTGSTDENEYLSLPLDDLSDNLNQEEEALELEEIVLDEKKDEYLSIPSDDLSDDLVAPEETLELEEIKLDKKDEGSVRKNINEEIFKEELTTSKNIFTLDDVSVELTTAHTRDEIADIIMAYAGQEFGQAAIFFVKKDDIIGWKAIGSDNSSNNIRTFKTALNGPSILKEVSSNNGYFIGPVPETPVNSELIGKLGGQWPSTILLLPIMMMGKLVSILYFEGDKELLKKKLTDMQKLTYKTAMAFDILILKNKIMKV